MDESPERPGAAHPYANPANDGGFRAARPLEPDLAALFEAYAGGFDDFDEEAVAACFAYPTTIWQNGRGNVFNDAEELIENIEALFDVFEAEEIVRSTFTVTDWRAAGDSAWAVLFWRQEREDGEVALAFECRYAMIRGAEDAAERDDADADADVDGETLARAPGTGAWRIVLAMLA
jgi:hypothetical protein